MVAFGPARALEWLRQHQRHLGASAALSDRLGALPTERWLVRREGFLSQAYRLLGACDLLLWDLNRCTRGKQPRKHINAA